MVLTAARGAPRALKFDEIILVDLDLSSNTRP
jgi:hypothetical protein